MGISELQIVKRDGKRETFSIEKIKRAVSKAFLSVGGYATEDDLISVLGRVHVSDGMLCRRGLSFLPEKHPHCLLFISFLLTFALAYNLF